MANFGDRLGKRYAALSSLWRRDLHAGQFAKVAEVPTSGATDWEHFVLNEDHYLAVSNEGDLQKGGTGQTSRIYRLVLNAADAPGAAAVAKAAAESRDELRVQTCVDAELVLAVQWWRLFRPALPY